MRAAREEPRGNWYLLTGLIIGVAAGLLFSLVFFPLRYSDTEPSALSEAYKSEYRKLIALAFQANGNIPRARDRLALLHDDNAPSALAAQAQRIVAEGGSPDEARSLASLAAALTSGLALTPNSAEPAGGLTATLPEVSQEAAAGTGTPLPGAAIQTATPIRPTSTPRPTFTPHPSATPPRVLNAPFKLVKKSEVCDASLPAGSVAIQVNDRDGNPLPGVPILVTWGEGLSSTFYTGLAPDVNPGYADFQMDPNVTYALKVGEASDPVTNLGAPACAGGAWKFEFQEGGS
jgi:hypothetical protein